ncbi:hypothetical protein T4C_8479 [Trichinella pseudospiralis]|uniref:Uncharacterized protein n=1 Tax=Trichinella pseudospiralis TaxID=6337 RepID=A0A0V1HAL1_TRIPS|nr:hypothetical protein T4C_8479 [Trichinella pseudospiralis]
MATVLSIHWPGNIEDQTSHRENGRKPFWRIKLCPKANACCCWWITQGREVGIGSGETHAKKLGEKSSEHNETSPFCQEGSGKRQHKN